MKMFYFSKNIFIDKFVQTETTLLRKKYSSKKKIHGEICFYAAPNSVTKCFSLRFANKSPCKFICCMVVFAVVFNLIQWS